MNPTIQPEPQTQAILRNWKVVLSYDGTNYSGWQVQPGQQTIQGDLQAALRRVTGESPLPQGSGRTDAGVHALAQVASFPLRASIPAENLRRALNRTLPAAVRILEARIVPGDFHARHSSVAKTYEYRVFLEKSRLGMDVAGRDTLCPPFLARYVYANRCPMAYEALQDAAQALVGTHDFMSFAATDPDLTMRVRDHEHDSDREAGAAPCEPFVLPTTTRTIFGSFWEQREIEDGTLLVYRVRGSGFLHHMVRNLVGTMLDVGRGHRDAGEIPKIIAARSRSAAGPTAPARGLFLHSVEYAPHSGI